MKSQPSPIAVRLRKMPWCTGRYPRPAADVTHASAVETSSQFRLSANPTPNRLCWRVTRNASRCPVHSDVTQGARKSAACSATLPSGVVTVCITLSDCTPCWCQLGSHVMWCEPARPWPSYRTSTELIYRQMAMLPLPGHLPLPRRHDIIRRVTLDDNTVVFLSFYGAALLERIVYTGNIVGRRCFVSCFVCYPLFLNTRITYANSVVRVDFV